MPRPDDERNEAQHKKARHRSDRAWNVVRFEELEPPRGLRSDAQSRLLQTIPRVNNLKASQDSTKLISAKHARHRRLLRVSLDRSCQCESTRADEFEAAKGELVGALSVSFLANHCSYLQEIESPRTSSGFMNR